MKAEEERPSRFGVKIDFDFEDESLICDVCRENEAVGVASSSLGAISFAYCRECLQNRAEPAGLLRAVIEDAGGLEYMAGWVRDLTGYVDGRYVPVEELLTMEVGNERD